MRAVVYNAGQANEEVINPADTTNGDLIMLALTKTVTDPAKEEGEWQRHLAKNNVLIG